MAYLEILTRTQLVLVATSFILGLIFGAFYDIIRFVYILGGLLSLDGRKTVERKGTLPFCCRLFADLAVSLVMGAAFAVFVYWVNDGQFRWFMAAFAAGGFALWRVTLSVPAMFCADRLARLLKAAVRILLIVPVGRILSLAARGSRSLGRLTARLAVTLYRETAGRAVRRSRRKRALDRTERARLRLAEDVSFEGEEGTRP